MYKHKYQSIDAPARMYVKIEVRNMIGPESIVIPIALFPSTPIII